MKYSLTKKRETYTTNMEKRVSKKVEAVVVIHLTYSVCLVVVVENLNNQDQRKESQ